MDTDEIERRFFAEVPEAFCRGLLRAVFAARRMAWDHCQSEFPQEESDNVRPWYARGKIESLMREASALHGGMSARVVKASKSPWNHTEVLSGRVLLTAAGVQQPCGPVNKAEFRLGLARTNQYSLFDYDAGEEQPSLYALLLCTPFHALTRDEAQMFGYLPGSAYIAFPAADLESYVHEISLFDKYPDIVESNYPQEWDQAARVSYLFNARKNNWSAA